MQSLTIRRPDDWHVHLRDGDMLRLVAPYTARQFARAIVMPNLVPPVTTVAAAAAYRERIRAAAGPRLHAADDLLPDRRGRSDEIARASRRRLGRRQALSGQRDDQLRRASPTSATSIRRSSGCSGSACRLCVHGEVTDPDVDVFDREAVFIDRVLIGWCATFPTLKIVFEHITTAEAADFVERCRAERRRDDHAAAPASSTAMPCSPAACGRTLIACRSRSARSTASRSARRRPRARPNSSSAPTAPRMPARPRSPHAAARGIFNAPFALESYARCSRRKARSTGSRASPRSMARASTACRSTRARSRWSATGTRCPSLSATSISSRSTPARR